MTQRQREAIDSMLRASPFDPAGGLREQRLSFDKMAIAATLPGDVLTPPGSWWRAGHLGSAFLAPEQLAPADKEVRAQMRYIALEEAFSVPELADRQPEPWQGFRIGQRYVADRARKLPDFTESRLPEMDAAGIDVQVLSLTVPGLQADIDTPAARENARFANDYLARVVAEHLRDVLLGQIPSVLQRGLYAILALCAAVITVAAVGAGIYGLPAAVGAVLACFLIRALGVRYNLNAPMAPERAFADHAPEVTPSELVRRNIWITTAGAFTDEPLRCASTQSARAPIGPPLDPAR